MLKQPLFGQDSSPHITSMLISAIATLVCWIIFCVMCFVIKFKPAVPEYKEIQIVLSSTPIADPEPVEGLVEEAATAEAAAPAEELAVAEPVEAQAPEIPNPVETPAAVAKVEAPKETPAPAKPKETPKTQTKTQSQPAKTTTTQTTKTTDPSKKVDFDNMTYATDYSDFSFNNSSSSSSKSSFDWSQFDDSDTEEVQVSQKVDKVTTQSTISKETAAQTTTQKTQTQTSSQNKTQNTTPAASSETTSKLSNIKSNNYSATSGDSKTITNAKTSKTSDGQISMQMKDGTTRVLLDPITPAIKLSSEAASLIDSNRTVNIEFRVLASGNVPRGEIKISPESILPQKVRDEIYAQLSTWIFEASSSAAYASFEYTIEKR